MSVTFQQIMGFHPDNRTVYEEIRGSIGQLLPFVGAGLTADVYGTWGGALEKLGSKLTDPDAIEGLHRLLDTGDYFGAAQHLEDRRGALNFATDLVYHFAPDKLDENRKAIKRGAIWLLPDLFECPVLTTNFDQSIERVYRERGNACFEQIDPFSVGLRRQATRLKGQPCVFKLHGTVVAGLTDYARLVFTKEQYDAHYGPKGDAREALRDFVDRRAFIFLGCSLRADATVDVLRMAAGSGATNFAIVACEPDERDGRIRDLSQVGIRAIVYEEGRYEATRVVLEKLLEDIDPDAYRLIKPKVSALPTLEGLSPYVYYSGMIPLIGRDEELAQLVEFVSSTDDSFRWWALTGPGGSGKSRLALELRRHVEMMPGWATRKLGPFDYGELDSMLSGLDRPTLVVADYVQAHAHELGVCIGRLATRPRASQLRLLLVEREGAHIDDIGRQPYWQRQLVGAARGARQKVISGAWESECLALEPLDDDDLLQIVDAFAASLKNRGLVSRRLPSKSERVDLVNRLGEVDPSLRRPLFALFLTGAWMAGEDPLRWDRQSVLDHFIDRELDRLDGRVGAVLGDDGRMREAVLEACAYIIRLSTALRGLGLGDMRDLCPSEWSVIERAAREGWFDDAEELLRRLGLVRNGALVPMEPDLVGEYFVCKWLWREASVAKRAEFLERAWSRAIPAFIFFDDASADYRYILDEKPDYWKYLFPSVSSRYSNYDKDLYIAIWLTNVSAQCIDRSVRSKVVELVRQLHEWHPTDEDMTSILDTAVLNLKYCNSREDVLKTTTVSGDSRKGSRVIGAAGIVFVNLSDLQDTKSSKR